MAIRHNLQYIIIALSAIFSAAATGCIEDGFTTDASDQPTFSTDTLNLGTVFTEAGTPTYNFMVYNRADKNLRISSIMLRGGSEVFRLNVDGISARQFSDVEIRPNDSIFVLVEATLPANGVNTPVLVEEHLDFLTNGITSTVVLRAEGQDINRHKGLVITEDTRFTADRPYQIYDSIIVAKDATLTIDAGTTLYFHDKAMMRVDGTLVCNGTPEAFIAFRGDRTDNVVGKINYEIMSGQWGGVTFSPSSRNNVMSHTNVRNSSYGVQADSIAPSATPGLMLKNCILRNSAGSNLTVYHSDVTAVGCEFAEAATGVVWLHGGSHTFNHCTFSNYYLFAVPSTPIINFSHIDAESDDQSGLPYTAAEITNSIVYGLGAELSHGDLGGTSIRLHRCLLKSAGEDDDNFIDCLWESDPLFYTVREEYLFDYRLRDESPAIAAADPSLTLPTAAIDICGLPRGTAPDLGAYVYTPEEK